MARIIEVDKSFRIIEVTESEVKNKIGGFGICDSCNGFFGKFKYIAVLNSCYCQECFDKWYNTAVYYPEDKKYEEMCYDRMLKMLDSEEVYQAPEANVIEDLFDDFFASVSDEIKEEERENYRGLYYAVSGHFFNFIQNETAMIGVINVPKIFSKVEKSIDQYIEELKINLNK